MYRLIFGMRVSRETHIIFLLAKCDDTSNEAVDKLELNCNQYAGLDICDRSDELKDEDFEAKKMCCACGGGSVPMKGTLI